jgi:hypothetical protein
LITPLAILGVVQQRVPADMLLLPLGMAVFGYLLMRWIRIFSIADEVWLDGERIIVRNGEQEDEFPVSNILEVKSSTLVNPERIVLTLSEPCAFGQEIVFLPPFRVWHFTRHPLAGELTRLAQEARGGV